MTLHCTFEASEARQWPFESTEGNQRMGMVGWQNARTRRRECGDGTLWAEMDAKERMASTASEGIADVMAVASGTHFV